MAKTCVELLSLLLLCVVSSSREASDTRKKTWLMETDTLPRENSTGQWLVDFRKMAAVGNGHVATVIYSPTVYMNGLYNGPVGWTHRAAIQSVHNIAISVMGQEVSRIYALDMWKAVFTETIQTKGLQIKCMTYAHQRLVQLLVSEIHVTRTDDSNKEFILMVERSQINDTIDLAIQEPVILTNLKGCGDVICKHTFGQTFIKEREDAAIGKIHIYWTDIPSTLHVGANDKEKMWTFVSSYDQEQFKALPAFRTALNLMTSAPDFLRETHEKAWADKWNSGRIDVEGDDDLDTVIHASLYYILMSLPSTQPELPLEQFYGLSPGSLARGANWTDYQGHVFWDMEIWMYPPVLLLFPDLARVMLSYRIYGGQGALAKAQDHGYEGWQFPWESAFTGYEMTPLICVACREYEQHITADVAFAARQYWAMTRHQHWLQEEGGLDLILNTATFWADKAEYNEEQDRYDINGIMPPDEYAEHVNNSIYTNYLAKINLQLADYITCLAGKQQQDPALTQRRQDVIKKLYLVFNESGRYHPEYEGYDDIDTAWKNNQTVKQADVVLLGYPLGMKMDDDIRRNDLLLYAERTNPGGPAMTWSMLAVNWLDVGELDMAAENFNKSYTLYRRKPFNTWSEASSGITDTGRIGATNFITGMGGFLQAVVFGYAGIRIQLERLTFNPRLPPNTHTLRVSGINYLGATFDMFVTAQRVLMVVREMDDKFPLQLKAETAGTIWLLRTGQEIVLGLGPFEISTLAVTECPVAEDSSCPDVVTADNSSGAKTSVPANIVVVLISQTGGDRCRDFLACSRSVQSLVEQNDDVNFYIGDDQRIYQGAIMTKEAGTLNVALLGDYTLFPMTKQQEALLRLLIKCGMESEPMSIKENYRLRYAASSESTEDCWSAPCAGNALHCQLKDWQHWDPGQGGVDPNCRPNQQTLTTPSLTVPPSAADVSTLQPWNETTKCSPVRPAEVTCNCQTSGSGAQRVPSLTVLAFLLPFVFRRMH